MSVILNRLGIDHVGFNLTTTGDNTAQCTLDSLLLDSTKEYVMRVTELNAPATLPIFGFAADTKVLNQELFRIKKRIVGTSILNFDAGMETNFSSSFRTISSNENPYFTVASFIVELAKSANKFTQQQDEYGVGWSAPNIPANVENEYLRIRLNADSCVEFIGTSIFWNNFCIQFSDYGKAIFGISKFCDSNNVMAISVSAANGNLLYTMFEAGYVVNFQNQVDLLVYTAKIVGTYPLLQNLDHRYFVSAETDLIIAQSIKCVDGKETTDRSICKAYFPMRCSVHMESEDSVLREDVDFEFATRTGQHSFIAKTNPSRHWVSLQTSYDLRFFRFNLFVTYRRFQNNKFVFTRVKYPIEKHQSWDLSVEFVSKL